MAQSASLPGDEFHRRYEAEQALKGDPPRSIWQRSFVAEDTADSPAMAMFGIGAHLAELTQELKDAGAAQATIDDLNRGFGNLRDAVADPSAALVEPVIERMTESLMALADFHLALADKCADLERQIGVCGRRLTEPSGDDGDLPF